MKKTPLTLAVISALVAPPVFADVEVGPLTIFGHLQPTLELVTVTGTATQAGTNSNNSQSRLNDNGSSLGFKGKYDLEGGVFALAQIDSRIFAGNGGNTSDDKAEFGTRNTFAGIGSATMGTLRMGRYDNAYKLARRQMSPTMASPLNDAISDYNAGQILTRMGNRLGDVVAYESPVMGGVSVLASCNFGKDATNSISGGSANNTAVNTVATTTMPQLALGLGYAVGNFNVGVSYTKVGNANWKLDSSSSAKAVNTTTGEQKLESYQIGGEYRFGHFSIGATSERVSSSLTGVGGFDQTQDSVGLIGGYVDGPLEVQLRFAQAYDVSGTGVTNADTGATQTSLGAEYKMSKNLSLVGSVTNVNNARSASYTSYTGFPLAKGNGMNMVSLGINVRF